jgi:hypothetical protein
MPKATSGLPGRAAAISASSIARAEGERDPDVRRPVRARHRQAGADLGLPDGSESRSAFTTRRPARPKSCAPARVRVLAALQQRPMARSG